MSLIFLGITPCNNVIFVPDTIERFTNFQAQFIFYEYKYLFCGGGEVV